MQEAKASGVLMHATNYKSNKRKNALNLFKAQSAARPLFESFVAQAFGILASRPRPPCLQGHRLWQEGSVRART